jgi:hypothetical protein
MNELQAYKGLGGAKSNMQFKEKISVTSIEESYLQLISLKIKQSEPEHRVSWYLSVQGD